MKTYFKSTRLTRIALLFFLAFLVTAMNSCRKEKTPTGSFLFYTMLDNSKFDAIKIFVDGKPVGDITLTHIERPACGTPTSINVISVPLPAGTHSWSAKQFLGGQEIDEWDERDETIEEGACNYVKLVE